MYVVSLITPVAHYTSYEEKSDELIRTVDYNEDHDVPFTFFTNRVAAAQCHRKPSINISNLCSVVYVTKRTRSSDVLTRTVHVSALF